MKTEEDIVQRELELVEAALYVTGRPIGLRTLGNVIGTRSKDKILSLAQQLVEKYDKCDCALEVLEVKEQRFVMQLKSEYSKPVRSLSFHSMLTRGPLKTLSFIAYHQPVLQTRVIEARGSHAYKHLKLLEEHNLIIRKISGRTKLIRTTTLFADYFGLSHDLRALKRQIKNHFKTEI